MEKNNKLYVIVNESIEGDKYIFKMLGVGSEPLNKETRQQYNMKLKSSEIKCDVQEMKIHDIRQEWFNWTHDVAVDMPERFRLKSGDNVYVVCVIEHCSVSDVLVTHKMLDFCYVCRTKKDAQMKVVEFLDIMNGKYVIKLNRYELVECSKDKIHYSICTNTFEIICRIYKTKII